jgi:hypothetical protein
MYTWVCDFSSPAYRVTQSSDFNLIWWSCNHGTRACQSWKGLRALSS